MMSYQNVKKIVKFNNGNGALLCNHCNKIVAYGFDHEDRYHYCDDTCRDKHEEFVNKWRSEHPNNFNE